MAKRNLRYYLFSDFLFQFATGMSFMALNWGAFSSSGSNQLVANINNVDALSGLLIAFFVGVFIDKRSKKNTMIFALLIRLLLLIIPVFLMAELGFNRYLYYLIALSNGVGWNIYLPASKSLLQELSLGGDLVVTNSKAEMVMQVGMFSSGLLAGYLYKFIGVVAIQLCCCGLFLISTLLISRIKLNVKVASEKIGLELKNNTLLEGVSYLKCNWNIALLGFIMHLPFIASSIINTTLPGYVSQVLKSDSRVYGMIDMFYGIGACIAGIFVIILIKKFAYGKILYCCFIICIGFSFILFINTTIIGTAISILAFGVGGPAIRMISSSLMMKIVPNSYLGRTIAICNGVTLIIQSLIIYGIGKVADYIGVAYGFLIFLGIMIIGMLIYTFLRRTKNSILKSDLLDTVLCQDLEQVKINNES